MLLGADFIKSATLGFFLNIVGTFLSRFADQGLSVLVPGEPHINHVHVQYRRKTWGEREVRSRPVKEALRPEAPAAF